VTQPKVVSLSAPERQKSAVPPILHSVRQHAKRQLNTLLQELFNNTDDALFEMADRSHSNSDQQMFFESMRQIRLRRKTISSQFVKELYQGIDAIFQFGGHIDPIAGDTGADQMALVQNDELEVSVAIAGIVSKVTSQFSLPVMQLTKRMDHLCRDFEVTERLNPLGPQRISQSFVSAIETLEVDIKVRIILLKLFERFVMERLGPMYDEANSFLIDAGVLPDLTKAMRQSQHASPAAASVAPEDGHHQPHREPGNGSGAGARGGASARGGAEGTEPPPGFAAAPRSTAVGGFGVIQNLLAKIRGSSASPTPSPGEIISTPDLVTVLSGAQTDAEHQPFDLTQSPPTLDLRHVVATKAEQVIGQHGASMAQADDDTVNFVGMLFDYILNDRNLAIPMKALIGRLQIPVVKLGVIDKTFFEKSAHPARQLLNELSSAGIGWSAATELKRDALYNKIESIVVRVMNGFKEDPDIFTDLLKELRGFVKKDDKRHALVEQRIKDTEAGKAKTIAAKTTVQQLINQKASGLRLPPEVGHFISNTWSKVLVYACVKQGTTSPMWQRDVQALDDLLWCLQPLQNTEDLDRREQLVPSLLRALRSGMEHRKFAAGERSELMGMLGSQLTQIAERDRAFLIDNSDDATADSHRSVGALTEDALEELDEIVLTVAQEIVAAEANVAPEPQFLEQINGLREGIWVELTQESGDPVRCKLAAIVQPGDRYVFVNRRGMKVMEKTKMGLAVELKKKTLTILDESQVFDRALQAVIGNLRKMQREPLPQPQSAL
jgi:hypothetical protein